MARLVRTPFDPNGAEGRVTCPQARMVRLSAVELRAV